MSDNILRVIPLGGLGEVGKNMTVFEIADQLIVIDAGLAFPRDEHLGVDLILPDFGYLHDREVLAVILTHAHEDHVGSLPYLLREVRVRTVLATRLTLGLVKAKLAEHGLLKTTGAREGGPHSGPDAVGVCLEPPAGRLFHTADWKVDPPPVDGLRTDVGRLAELGNRGV